MPEFEETQHRPDPREDYAPGQDSEVDSASASSKEQTQKPRSRRRSQGFKKMPAGDSKLTAASAEAAADKPSTSAYPTPDTQDRTLESPAPEDAESRPEAEKRQPKRNFPEDDAQPEPSAEMLARISEIESRLAERKQERSGSRQSQSATRDNENRDKSRSSPRSSRNSGDNSRRQRSPRERSGKSSRPQSSSRRSSEPGILKKLTGFIGGLFNREQPLPPEPDLPPQVASSSGRAPAERGSSGSGRRRSGSGGSGRRGGNGPSRGANNSRHRGRSANRRDANKADS
jgi:hypothetical protein